MLLLLTDVRAEWPDLSLGVVERAEQPGLPLRAVSEGREAQPPHPNWAPQEARLGWGDAVGGGGEEEDLPGGGGGCQGRLNSFTDSRVGQNPD